jgi:hypothetical protein
MRTVCAFLFAFDKWQGQFAAVNVLTFFCCGEKACFAGGFAKTCGLNVVFLW